MYVCIFAAGYGVVVVKNGQRICGTGAALANAPIVQNKAYFEAKLQSSGNCNPTCSFQRCLQLFIYKFECNEFCFHTCLEICYNLWIISNHFS